MGLGIETSITNLIRGFRSGYRYKPDHHIVNDYCEFSGLGRKAVVRNIHKYKKLTHKDWYQCVPGGSWEEKAKSFYGTSSSYVYDLLANNYSLSFVEAKLNGFDPEILRLIKAHLGNTTLEFGGGLGVFCELMTQFGKQVTCLDIPGHVYDFAAWRFKRYNLPIEMICSSPTRLSLERQYDIIFTDAAFEHLVDPAQVLDELISHLVPDGLFVFLVDLEGHTEELPMHRDIDIDSLHKQILNLGLKNVINHNKFASIWVGPKNNLSNFDRHLERNQYANA